MTTNDLWPWSAVTGLALGYALAERGCALSLLVLSLIAGALAVLGRPLAWLFMLGLLGGQLQVSALVHLRDREPLAARNGQSIELEGIVVTSPARGAASLRFLFETNEPPAVLEATIAGKTLPSVAMGERWHLVGKLQAAPSESYPGGPDRALQLARKGIWHQLFVPLGDGKKARFTGSAHRVAPPQANGAWGAVMCLRVRLVECFRRRFAGREAELMAGIVLGEAQGLDDELQQAFRATGTSHLLAASGANVAILLGVLLWIGERLGYSPYRVALPCLGAVWLTVALAGFSPSIVRAGWMAALALLARFLGRDASAARTLSLACLISLALHPDYLFDVSFQLSAGAVASLVTLGRALGSLSKRRLWQQMAMTISVTIGLWPVFAWQFQSLQPGALLCNILLAPPMEALLPIGLALAGLDFVWPPLARPVVGLSRILLVWSLATVNFLAPKMPQLVLTRPGPLELLTWALATLALYAALRGRFRRACVLWLGAILALLGQRVPAPNVPRLRVRVVEVRRRPAMWVSTPSGQELLVLDDPSQQSSLESMLRTHGVARADAVLHHGVKSGRLRLGWDDDTVNVWIGNDPPPGTALAISQEDLPVELESDGTRLWWRRWR